MNFNNSIVYGMYPPECFLGNLLIALRLATHYSMMEQNGNVA